MTLTVSQFRGDFAEFTDATSYPDALIASRITVASQHVDQSRWQDMSTYGIELATAHYVVLAKRRMVQAAAGIPGEVKGVQTSKSVGDVSASYDVSSILGERAGHWNQTSYGIEFQRFVRIFGAGGIQLPLAC